VTADLAAGFCGEKHVEDFVERVGTTYVAQRVTVTTRRKLWYRDDLDRAMTIGAAERVMSSSLPERDRACAGERQRHAAPRVSHEVLQDRVWIPDRLGEADEQEPFKRFRAERIVFHGLRRSAVINLLEVGRTENHLGAICNMLRRWFSTVGGRSLCAVWRAMR
jgi:hypothetical protein